MGQENRFDDLETAIAKSKALMSRATAEKPFSENGVIKRLGRRFLMVSTEYFTAGLMKDIIEFAGEEAAAAILYRGGYQSGRTIFRRYYSIVKDKDIALNLCTSSAWYFGWGVATIYMEKKDDEIIGHARVYNSFEVDAYENMENFKGGKVCHFFRGVIAGITAEYVGKPYNGEEIMCKAEGKPYCEFVTKPVKEEQLIMMPKMEK